MSFTIGSLFDGSGGFPLAGFLCGGVPVWASEIEPYPIAVTKSRFPHVKHLGSVTDIKGDEIEPVDVITFGSPCQDLSVAGKRAGLKHEDNGDDETTRSGLFMEAVRIIKEMREKTNGKYPRFAVWENVPGAFSSNKGEDFKIVLEELIKITEPSAVMPDVPQKGWAYADSYRGDGWSIAYRVFDAQYWGVPQRRRRIYLVADFRGECAREVLFKCKSLRGYSSQSRTSWETAPSDVESGIGATDRENGCVIAIDKESYSSGSGFDRTPGIAVDGPVVTLQANGAPHARGNGDGAIANTITGDHENRITDYTSVVIECCIDDDKIGKAERDGGSGLGIRPGDKMYTLTAKDVHGVGYLASGKDTTGTLMASMATKQCLGDQEAFSGDYHIIEEKNEIYRQGGFADYIEGEAGTVRASGGDLGGGSENLVVSYPRYIVRRLTPTECARLQGFPDDWGHPDKKDDFTDEEYAFWLNVRNTHAEINGKQVKDYTKAQMLTWYNKLHTDSSEYKMWGNGIALPNALYVMQGISDVYTSV